MSLTSIPQLSLGAAVMVIFALCAGVILFKRVARIVMGTLTVAASAWIAFQIWQQAPDLAVQLTGKPNAWITNGFPICTFITAIVVIRKIGGILVRPFGGADDEDRPRSAFSIAFGLLMALIPAAVISLAGIAFIHYSGSVEEIRQNSRSQKSPTSHSDQNPWVQNLKTGIEAAVPASWLKTVDPYAEPSRVALAKLITAKSQAPLKPVINPKTGRPIPRAIIVEDPELQKLARDGKFGTLLRHPLLTKALADPTIKKLLHEIGF